LCDAGDFLELAKEQYAHAHIAILSRSRANEKRARLEQVLFASAIRSGYNAGRSLAFHSLRALASVRIGRAVQAL
jgi:hypothetical protein